MEAGRNNLARTPPMGWMSWQEFRCDVDCVNDPDHCINEQLYMGQADALVKGGYAAAGYNSIHIDDCWMAAQRDPTTKKLVVSMYTYNTFIMFNLKNKTHVFIFNLMII